MLSKFVSFRVGFLAFLWPHVAKKHGVSEIRVFLGRIFAFLWPQVAKKHGISEIRVFLGRTNFILWVSSLARVVNWK